MLVSMAVVLAAAQAPEVSLAEALELARAHQPALEAARARVAAAGEDERAAWAQWLPRAGLMAQWVASTTNNSTATVISTQAVDLPRIGATPIAGPSMRPEVSSVVAVGVRQQVLDFGKTGADARVAAARTDIERRRLEQTALELDIAVTQAWYAVKAADAMRVAARSALDRASSHAELIAAGTRANLRAPVELARGQAEVERARVTVVRAEAAAETSRRQLAAVVGDGRDALSAAGPSPEPPALPGLEAVLEVAERSDPRLKEAEARLEAQRSLAASIGAQWRPTLSATAALSGRAGGATPSSGAVPFGAGALPVVPNWDVGLLLTWPALEPVVLARATAAGHTEAAFAAELVGLRQQQRSAASLTWLEADSAARALPALEAAARAAMTAQEQADARYRLGLGTLVELTDAESLRTDAEMQLALGRLAHARATAALTRWNPLVNP